MDSLPDRDILDEVKRLRAFAEQQNKVEDGPCDHSPNGLHLPDYNLGIDGEEVITVCAHCHKRLSSRPR